MSNSEDRNEQTKEKPLLFYGAIDERTKAVAAGGDAWAGRFLIFALLLDVVCRGLIIKEASWDLLALVVIASGISNVYQYKNKVFARGAFLRGGLMIAGLGAIIGALGVAVLLVIMKWAHR